MRLLLHVNPVHEGTAVESKPTSHLHVAEEIAVISIFLLLAIDAFWARRQVRVRLEMLRCLISALDDGAPRGVLVHLCVSVIVKTSAGRELLTRNHVRRDNFVHFGSWRRRLVSTFFALRRVIPILLMRSVIAPLAESSKGAERCLDGERRLGRWHERISCREPTTELFGFGRVVDGKDHVLEVSLVGVELSFKHLDDGIDGVPEGTCAEGTEYESLVLARSSGV